MQPKKQFNHHCLLLLWKLYDVREFYAYFLNNQVMINLLLFRVVLALPSSTVNFGLLTDTDWRKLTQNDLVVDDSTRPWPPTNTQTTKNRLQEKSNEHIYEISNEFEIYIGSGTSPTVWRRCPAITQNAGVCRVFPAVHPIMFRAACI